MAFSIVCNMKLQQLQNGQYIITLPKKVIESLERWEKGSEIKVFVERGDLVLRKV